MKYGINSTNRLARIACAAFAAAAFSGASASAVVIDGAVGAGEYTNATNLYFGDQQAGVTIAEPGKMYWSVDSATGNVSAAFVMPLALNDNTYGTGAVGWGTKGHKFGDLTGSDKGQFDFTDSTGKLVLSFNVDYFSAIGDKNNPTGFDSLGVNGGDGKMLIGDKSDVLGATSSLDYNFNVLGYSNFTTNSPTTSVSLIPGTTKVDYSKPYADSTQAPGWIYEIIYEVQVDGSAFGAAGFGGVNFPSAHNSPSKVGINTVPQTPVPEPSTAIMLSALLSALAFSRRSQQAIRS